MRFDHTDRWTLDTGTTVGDSSINCRGHGSDSAGTGIECSASVISHPFDAWYEDYCWSYGTATTHLLTGLSLSPCTGLKRLIKR